MQYRFFELLLLTSIYSLPFMDVPKVVEAKTTTVVLLNNGKTQNAVMVSTEKGSANLDRIGAYVDMSDKKKAPPAPKMMPPEEIKKRFAKALSASPQKGLVFRLYFQAKQMKLTEESEKILQTAIKMMLKRTPCMVDIIGHTDTMGSSELNVKVSLKRAKYIEGIIKEKNIEVSSLVAKGYGEEDLLVETPDNTVEAKNRNVEIFIK